MTTDEVLQEIRLAGDALAVAVAHEMALEDDRALVKAEAIRRLIDSGAAASVTAAEKVVAQDTGYNAHLVQQREATYQKIVAAARYEAAKARARLAASMVEA